MANQQNKPTPKNTSSEAAPTTTTNLPGLRNVQVIISTPSLIKENSSKPTKK